MPGQVYNICSRPLFLTIAGGKHSVLAEPPTHLLLLICFHMTELAGFGFTKNFRLFVGQVARGSTCLNVFTLVHNYTMLVKRNATLIHEFFVSSLEEVDQL